MSLNLPHPGLYDSNRSSASVRGGEVMTQTEVLIEGYRRDWNRAEEKRLEALIEQEESDLVILQAALEVAKRDLSRSRTEGKK